MEPAGGYQLWRFSRESTWLPLSSCSFLSPWKSSLGESLWSFRKVLSIVGLSLLASFWLEAQAGVPAPSIPARLSQWVEANILAVHAYQVGLVKTTGKGDPACYGSCGSDEAALNRVVDHQASLLGTDLDVLKAWAQGAELSPNPRRVPEPRLGSRLWAVPFNPALDLEPVLNSGLKVPEQALVNRFTRYLAGQVQAPDYQIRAIANLYQIVLEVERDGNILQKVMDSYIALGLPVYVGQLGLPGSDEALLEAGRQLASQSCPSPFDTAPAAWQIAGRKIWNWGEKKLHLRDEKVLARELLAEREIQPLIPLMKTLPPQKIAVIGHSFTMGAHWSSPSSFVPIVAAMFAMENPAILFRQYQAGGLTASRALRDLSPPAVKDNPVRTRFPQPPLQTFFDQAVAWKPDQVLLVVAVRREEDLAAVTQMGEGFARAGIQSFIFDDIGDPSSQNPAMLQQYNQAALSAGFSLLEVKAILEAAPERFQFRCLDGIHMTEPYHRLMAKEWLKFLLGARGLRLAGEQ
jgi:hypothetical protein